MCYITDLGELINRSSRDESEKSHHAAVEKAIADTWESAHQIKLQAVQDALQKAQLLHEKQTRQLIRQHKRAIKVSEAERRPRRINGSC